MLINYKKNRAWKDLHLQWNNNLTNPFVSIHKTHTTECLYSEGELIDFFPKPWILRVTSNRPYENIKESFLFVFQGIWLHSQEHQASASAPDTGDCFLGQPKDYIHLQNSLRQPGRGGATVLFLSFVAIGPSFNHRAKKTQRLSMFLRATVANCSHAISFYVCFHPRSRRLRMKLVALSLLWKADMFWKLLPRTALHMNNLSDFGRMPCPFSSKTTVFTLAFIHLEQIRH